jgi:hypothetical protein
MRTHPESAILLRRACGQDGQYELDILTRQWAQVHIHIVKPGWRVDSLKERSPERLDGVASGLVIEAEGYIAERRATFTVNG